MKINMNGLDLVGSPLKFSDNPVSYKLRPPTLGQHSFEVLSDLGYSTEEINILAKAKVIQIS